MNIGTYLARAKLTGRLYFQRATSSAYLDFGNIALVKNEPKIDRAQQLWKNNGLVQVGHEEPGKVDLRWSFKGDEHIAPALENLNLARAGTSTTQAAANGVVTVLLQPNWTSVALGLSYDLGYQNVSAVVITNGVATLVAGTDYILDAGTGMVKLVAAPNTPSSVSATFNCAQVVTTVYTQISEAFVRGTAKIVLKDLNDASPRQVIAFPAELATSDWGDNDGQKFNQFGLLLGATAAPTVQDRWLYIGNATQQVEADYFQARINAAGGVITAAEVQNLASFIYTLKNAGLWDSLVDLWPLRSGQNIGAGNTALALRGNNGTLVNAPTWGSNGLVFASASLQMVSLPQLFSVATGELSVLSVFQAQNGAIAQAIFSHDWAQEGARAPAGFSNYPAQGNHTLRVTQDGNQATSHDVTPAGVVGNFQFSALSGNATTLRGEFDAAQASVATTGNPFLGSDALWRFAANSDGGGASSFLNGTIAFIAIFSSFMTYAQSQSLRAALKTTLCHDLGLP